jgi:hypothetical protein
MRSAKISGNLSAFMVSGYPASTAFVEAAPLLNNANICFYCQYTSVPSLTLDASNTLTGLTTSQTITYNGTSYSLAGVFGNPVNATDLTELYLDLMVSTVSTISSGLGDYVYPGGDILNLTYLITFTAQTSIMERDLNLFRGNQQTANINSPLANPLVVKVVNPDGTAAPGVPMSFVVTPPVGATGFSLTTAAAIADANGIASTQLTLGNLPGAYQVTASCSGTTSCSPSTLTFTEYGSCLLPQASEFSWSQSQSHTTPNIYWGNDSYDHSY